MAVQLAVQRPSTFCTQRCAAGHARLTVQANPHTCHILPNKVAVQRGVSMTHTQMGNGVFYGLTLPYNAELANGIFYNVCSHQLNLDLEGV